MQYLKHLPWNTNNADPVVPLKDDNPFLQSHPIHSHFAYDSPLAADSVW